MAQDGSRMTPKWPKMASKEHSWYGKKWHPVEAGSKFSQNCVLPSRSPRTSIWGRLGHDFRPPRTGLWRPESSQKRSKGGPRQAGGGPGAAQDPPKIGLGASRAGKGDPREDQEPPRATQEPPKRHPRGTREALKRHSRGTQEPPKNGATQDPLKSGLGDPIAARSGPTAARERFKSF